MTPKRAAVGRIWDRPQHIEVAKSRPCGAPIIPLWVADGRHWKAQYRPVPSRHTPPQETSYISVLRPLRAPKCPTLSYPQGNFWRGPSHEERRTLRRPPSASRLRCSATALSARDCCEADATCRDCARRRSQSRNSPRLAARQILRLYGARKGWSFDDPRLSGQFSESRWSRSESMTRAFRYHVSASPFVSGSCETPV